MEPRRHISLGSIEAVLLALAISVLSLPSFAQETRIKDLTNIRGFRSNQLVGFGLIIGLQATGDSAASIATNKAVANMMTRLGMKLTKEQILTQSIAAVIATAELPAFKRNGDRIDVKVSTIGDASSLAGGTLLMTPLKAGDGKVYVISQGSVVVGQAAGAGASVLTTATVPDGGVVEREFSPSFSKNGKIMLSLRQPDFTTSSRVVDAVNLHFRGFYAQSRDPVSIEIEIPPLYRDRQTEFIADLEALKVDADQKAVVVLNERTGTVVMGSAVVIGKVAVAHGDLTIQIGEEEKAKTAGPKRVVNMGGSTVGELVESMNALGVKPADLVGILQAIHTAGALRAELRFM